jgi:hypothetical protein
MNVPAHQGQGNLSWVIANQILLSRGLSNSTKLAEYGNVISFMIHALLEEILAEQYSTVHPLITPLKQHHFRLWKGLWDIIFQLKHYYQEIFYVSILDLSIFYY